eukprot:4048143-Alexandrium_andersonii.AAC.1
MRAWTKTPKRPRCPLMPDVKLRSFKMPREPSALGPPPNRCSSKVAWKTLTRRAPGCSQWPSKQKV